MVVAQALSKKDILIVVTIKYAFPLNRKLYFPYPCGCTSLRLSKLFIKGELNPRGVIVFSVTPPALSI